MRSPQDQEFYDKYEALAQRIGIVSLRLRMPVSPSQIARALETDQHLNNIPLGLWDARHPQVCALASMAGIKFWSLGESVCLLKHVARHHYA
jgi:hypothetical protein